ncbi:UDP-N-acetylmuramate dehydrogenase [Candidatus Uhrbacteria bacterium]|nr:UDP-N-acetylmuramate dehydrogenase [Candidatus Uhrbacteria bacterium]
MSDISQQLKQIVGERMKEQEPMSRHTNFRIGGPARWFVEVRTLNELRQILDLAHQNKIAVFVMGGGSNTLVSDEGFDGMVIQMAMRGIRIEGTTAQAEAGVLSAALARATAQAGLSGFTWAISLPGTIGGAVRGNAGCFGGETKDHLVEAMVLRNGEIRTLSKSDLQFGYRESAIKHSSDIVLSATFSFKSGDSVALQADLEYKLSSRKSSQPLDAGSAGCLFKNYEVISEDELQRLQQKFDIPSEMSQARRISAGWLIDQLDLKGKQIGGAKISDKHGNFVVNTGTATADDVVQLIALIKTRARNELGVFLREEVELVGF